jgi:hypothetical protein
MNSNDQIINIIQQFLDSKGNYDSLKPVCIVHEGYVTANGVQFSPHEDYKDKAGYKLEIDLQDEAVRIEELNKLNVDIEAYNEWAGGRLEYPHLDLYHPYSFLVVRENTGQEKQYKDLWVGGKLYVEIVDEELYKLKEDEDFIPRFNRTIYEYLILQKDLAKEDKIWDEDNFWYKPYRNFAEYYYSSSVLGDLANYKPYDLGFQKIDVLDTLYSVVDDLTLDVCEKGTKKFRTLVEACDWWCAKHTHKGKIKSVQNLSSAYYKARSEGKL